MKSNIFQISHEIKSSKKVIPIGYTLEKIVFAASTFKDL